LHLIPHVNAPVADLPVRKMIGAHHFIANLTLPYGRVIYDCNRPGGEPAPRPVQP
jgi:acetoacetate decarboxylase